MYYLLPLVGYYIVPHLEYNLNTIVTAYVYNTLPSSQAT